ncbi:metal-dependent hydrolase [Natrialbaceae archaeon A-gly3]
MWPWGHLAVAYLLYTLFAHGRYGRPPRSGPAVALAIGSQFPDLIDKPLAWWLGVLPGGRTLAHSLLFAAVLLPAVYALGIRLDLLEAATAFAIGHLSHLLTDLPLLLLAGYPRGAEYLLWPLLDQPTFAPGYALFDAPAGLETAALVLAESSTYARVQVGLFALAAIVWYLDGRPGLG